MGTREWHEWHLPGARSKGQEKSGKRARPANDDGEAHTITITKVEVWALRGPKNERPHWTSHFPVPAGNEVLLLVHTSDPTIDPGVGLCTSYTDLAPLLKPW